MKLLHIADLHLGKRINGFSLLEDQRAVLSEAVAAVKSHGVDAVLIAGDLYDKSVPAGDSISLLDDFLTALLDLGVAVFLVAGNHDSAQRLQFASRILEKHGLYIAATFDGHLRRIELSDEFGPVHLYMMPYLSPAQTRAFYPNRQIRNHHEAVEALLREVALEPDARNILLAHHNVTPTSPAADMGAQTSIVGDLDNVGVCLFDGFEYVALGHIHKPYAVGREGVRYAGSILTITHKDLHLARGGYLVELREKGTLQVEFLPFTPPHRVLEIRGPFEALLAQGQKAPSEDLYFVILTDEDDVPDAMRRLRAVYKNVLHLSYDNTRTRHAREAAPYRAPAQLTIEAQFAAFFARQNGREMDEKSMALLKEQLALLQEEGRQ